MSLIKRGRLSYCPNNRQKKKKNLPKKRPVWDDSLTDLSVYRSNAEELAYRKMSHQSKHLPSIKFQRQKKASQKEEMLSTLGKLNPKQLAIMKEILYNQNDLQTVLNYSDRLMDKVKDVCGDNPKRFQAFPSVTSAPGSDASKAFKNNLPCELPEYQSSLDLLSNEVMSSVALNDGQIDKDEGSPTTSTSTYTSQMDMERFRRLLLAEEENLKNACATPKQQEIFAKIRADNECNSSDSEAVTPNSSFFGAPNSAANDTKKVNKVRKIVAEEEEDRVASATQIVLDGTIPHGLSLSDLKKALEELQSEMSVYEQNTGKISAEKETRESFSGYTMALLSSVIKLSRYLRETEEKLQIERMNRESLATEVTDLKIIVDALTSDLIQTQELYKNSEGELQNYRRIMDQEINALKKHVGLSSSEGLLGQNPRKEQTPSPSPPPTASEAVSAKSSPNSAFINVQRTQPLPAPPPSSQFTSETGKMDARNLGRKFPKSFESENHFPIWNPSKECSVFQPAFQLSPPVQKTRILTQNGTERQLSLIGIEDLALGTPSLFCQSTESQRIPLDQASKLRPIPQQNLANVVIPTEPIPLGQSQTVLESDPNSNGSIPAGSRFDSSKHFPVPSEPKEEFQIPSGLDYGNKEICRSVMLSKIEELDKQHQEAERLLKSLLQNQNPGIGLEIPDQPISPPPDLSNQIQINHRNPLPAEETVFAVSSHTSPVQDKP